MRGSDVDQTELFSYVSLESRIPTNHPLRPIRKMANAALRSLSSELGALYAKEGRPSIPPERLLRALLIQVLYSIRSERLLVEQLDYNFLFRWFVGMGTNEEVWDHSSFTTNRDRLLEGDIARRFFAAVMEQAKAQNLMSDEHFTVDGTNRSPAGSGPSHLSPTCKDVTLYRVASWHVRCGRRSPHCGRGFWGGALAPSPVGLAGRACGLSGLWPHFAIRMAFSREAARVARITMHTATRDTGWR